MKKVLMLATTAAMIEQFNKNNILILEKMGYEVHVIGNWKEGNPISEERLDEFKVWLMNHHGRWHHMPSTRKPTDFNNIVAYRQVVNLIRQEKFEFIHCHTPIGSVIARCAAHKTHTPIIYTAHGFHFFKGAPLKNWLLYYPIEWLCSWWTDVLITINQEDYERAKKRLHAKKIVYVQGVGIDVQKFGMDGAENIRSELEIKEDEVFIVSVGELIKRKNHRVVIRALTNIRNERFQYYIVGQGELNDYLKKLIIKEDLENKVHLLGYRKDVGNILAVADIFVFPSLQEGLPVALMEAMSSGLPVVCSKIRGNIELIENKMGGYLIEGLQDTGSYADAIMRLCKNKKLRIEYGEFNKKKVKGFSVDNVRKVMEQIYEEMQEECK